MKGIRRSEDQRIKGSAYWGHSVLHGTLVLLCWCAALMGNAQPVAQFIIWGDNAMLTGDHYGASHFYAEALEAEPGRLEWQWKFAEACRLCNRYPEAAEAYGAVQRKDLGRAHPAALRWLGEMQLCSGQYEEARKTWLKVKQKAKAKSGVDATRAENALAGIELARSASDDSLVLEHLPEPVNTYDSEFGARVGPDSALYFTTLRGELGPEQNVLDTAAYWARIHRSPRERGTHARSEEWSRTVGAHMANVTWSADGKWRYYTICNADGRCRINAQSDESGAVHLDGMDREANNTQPMISTVEGRPVMFFTSDRAGGQGGLDIWYGSINGSKISDIRSAGGLVNTAGNESCPWFDGSSQRLYFSSDFLPGLGGYDIHMSEWRSGTAATPVNAGKPLNSPANDLYPTFDARSGSGFITSNRIGSLAKKGETCCNDLYAYHRPGITKSVEPTVIPSPPPTTSTTEQRLTSLREKLPLRLYFHNDEPGPRSWAKSTGLTYDETYKSYKALLPDYHRAWADNAAGTQAIDDFFAHRVDHGHAQLNAFIDLLEQALNEGQRIQLGVRGFASPLAKSDYNANLSLRRISSLENQLRQAKGGALYKYLTNGALTITASPFGEDQSAREVSDRLEDLQGSVYSVGASLERRIEIEQVMLNAVVPDTLELTHDMGTLPQLQGRKIPFTIRNEGSTPLYLLRMRPDCDCTLVNELPTAAIPPGDSVEVIVEFNGRGPEGPMRKGVNIHTDGTPNVVRLVLTGVLTPFQ